MNAPTQTPTTNQPATGNAEGGTGRESLGDGFIMGNLTADPELRFTPSGRAVVSLRVAFSQRVRDDATGQWHDSEPEFYDVQAWGTQAENAAECLQRGDRIVAAGGWQREHYLNRDGEPRTVVRLVARDLGASMLFRQVRVQRSNRRGPTGPAGAPAAAPRPEGQRATPPPAQPADDPWAGDYASTQDDPEGGQ